MTYDRSRIDGYYCKNHTRYAGLRLPRVPCEACWWLYFAARGALWTQSVFGLLNRRVDKIVKKLTRQHERVVG